MCALWAILRPDSEKGDVDDFLSDEVVNLASLIVSSHRLLAGRARALSASNFNNRHDELKNDHTDWEI
jgi:hypothetical protein